MRFSIQEEGKDKEIFFTFGEANKKTGLDSRLIYAVLKRKDNRYRRKSDGKVFFIQKEEEDENLFIIDGEEINSFDEMKEKFGLTPTKISNQLIKNKRELTDVSGKVHKVEFMCELLQKALDEKRQYNLVRKIARDVGSDSTTVNFAKNF